MIERRITQTLKDASSYPSLTMHHRPFKTLVFVFVFSALITPRLWGQDAETTPILLGVQTRLDSDIMGEERPVLIYTPTGYEQSTERYPVIYLLDGDGHLLHTAGIAQFLANNGKMPGVIIVGIPNTDRTRDLTPPLREPGNNFPTAGGADTFLSFISDELIPYVEANYRTVPYRILIGHSFGGLFSVNALLKKPDLFNAHISISPSMWWDNKGLLTEAEAFFNANKEVSGSYYMTLGNEGGSMLAGVWGLAGIFEEHSPESFMWHFELMKEETHGSIPHRSTYHGLEWLYRDWEIDDFFERVQEGGIENIDTHYTALSEHFGYTITTPESVVNQVGYMLLGMEKFDGAIAIFERNVRDFPDSPNVYDSLGDAFKANGALEKAAESYKKACTMGTAVNHPNAAVYCKNAENVE